VEETWGNGTCKETRIWSGLYARLRKLETICEGEPMKPGTQDEVEGKLHDLKGKVKEKVGQLTNDPDLEAEGQAEEIAGKIQGKVGQVKKVLGK
jgi:uncharacterized protein YjbJ (UPF0337 family)